VKKLLWASVGIAFVAVVAFLLVRMATTQPRNGLRDAEIARVARRDIGSLVKATGIIKPMIGAQVRVGSRISGVVSRLFVKVGDRVRQGQALAELDARQLAAQQAEAAAALQVTEAELRYAEADLRRKRELMADQIIAQSELEVAERAFAVSERQRREAQARLEYADAQLDYARISAPIGGVVASVTTQEGETVAASLAAPTFVTLVDLARLEVWAYVDETDIGRIHAGQKARFTVDTYPGWCRRSSPCSSTPFSRRPSNASSTNTRKRSQRRRPTSKRPGG
jgi:RND family efflux transporter MFP subunit